MKYSEYAPNFYAATSRPSYRILAETRKGQSSRSRRKHTISGYGGCYAGQKKKKKEKKKKKQPTYDGSLAAHVHCFKRLRPATAPSWAFSVFISLAFNSRDATSSGRGKLSRYWTALLRVCRATSKPFFIFILG